jgi:hypothetical protein
VLMLFCVGTLLVASLSCSHSGPVGSSPEGRWRAVQDRGEVVFVSGNFLGGRERSLCVLNLPSCQVKVLSRFGDSGAGYRQRPRWEPDRRTVSFVGVGDDGVCVYDRATGNAVVAARWKLAYESDTLIVVSSEPGHLVTKRVPRPYEKAFDAEWVFGRTTGRLYCLRVTTSRKWLQPEEERTDLVVFDSVGHDSLLFTGNWEILRGFAVSRDETKFVIPDGTDLWIYDRVKGESLIPGRPEGFRLFAPEFGPHDSVLAVVGWSKTETRGRAAIFVSRPPDFVDFHMLAEIKDLNPWALCWSADGQWIIFSAPRKGDPFARVFDLWVLEVATRECFKLPFPYLLNGHPADTIYVEEGFDWSG